jgi:hypothetical protein
LDVDSPQRSSSGCIAVNCFQATGIYHLNKITFSDVDFTEAEVVSLKTCNIPSLVGVGSTSSINIWSWAPDWSSVVMWLWLRSMKHRDARASLLLPFIHPFFHTYFPIKEQGKLLMVIYMTHKHDCHSVWL